MKRSKIAVFTGIFCSLVSIIVILLLTGRDPVESMKFFYNGTFKDFYAFSEALLKMIPLTIAGLGCAIAFQAGQFNIGVEGQLIMGGMIAGFIGYAFSLPPVIHCIIAVFAGGIGAGLFAILPGLLKAKKGVNEILSTIMFNYVAIYLASYLSNGPLKAPGMMAAFPKIKRTAAIPLIGGGTRLHYGFFIMIGLIIITAVYMQRTVSGFKIRAIGANPVASMFNGINAPAEIVKSMFLSGFMAGLAGSIEILAVHGRFLPQFSPGYGFDSITSALIGNLNPFGVALASFFFGALRTGLGDMQIFMEMPKQLPTLMQGIIILFLAIFISMDFSFISIKTKRRKRL